MPTPLKVSDRVQIAFKPTKGFETPAVSPPYLRGANVLYDPGFEGFVRATYGIKSSERVSPTGADTYVLPFYDSSCATGGRWPDGTCNTQFSAWIQRNGTYSDPDGLATTAWHVSAADPNSGTWGAVWWDWQAETSLGHPALLMVQGFNHPAGLSARCSSGDTITWGANIKVTSTTGTPKVTSWITFYTSGGSALVSNTATSSLTTSYASYSTTVGAPSNAHYCRVMLDWEGTGASRTIVYVDDATLGVQ